DCVIENTTMDSLYEAPLMLHDNGLDTVVCRELGLDKKKPDLTEWQNLVKRIHSLKKNVKVGIVGKYVALHDAYLSVREALYHGGYENDASVDISWIDSEKITNENVAETLKGLDGIVVPGGFGERGIEGMVAACRYARENDIPYLGLCLGMQISVIEYARDVAGIEDANSREFDENGKHLVIDLMEDQMRIVRKGGTMRLGAYPCKIVKGTMLEKAYGLKQVDERHRHRFEFNNEYKDVLSKAGLKISGTSPDGAIVEAVEEPKNRFHVGVQFHPEFKSRPNKAHPLFREFITACVDKQQ
ncbi:MAG: CTP synthase, partial [Lachnospiraceae bacterium]|nr:CTP synthase [Lachnospiraceae bacterium]MDY4164085.1 CTP synthase [Lachnospiraceae bacterium]